MKVIDCKAAENDHQKPEMLRRIASSLGFLQRKSGPKAQETVTQILKKVLDNRFVLLQNAAIPGVEPPLPLILVGPPGVCLIEASPIKGVFRAMDDQWEEMDNQTQKFRPARVNLPARTASIAQRLLALLNSQGLTVPAVEPVILFTQPGAHIDATRPPARLVRSDAIVRFAASLLQNKPVLSPENIQEIVQRLQEPDLKLASIPGIPGQEIFEQEESASKAASPKKDVLTAQLSAALDTSEPEIIRRLSKRVAFTRRQWLILGALLVINVLILIAVILVVLIIT